MVVCHALNDLLEADTVVVAADESDQVAQMMQPVKILFHVFADNRAHDIANHFALWWLQRPHIVVVQANVIVDLGQVDLAAKRVVVVCLIICRYGH